MREYTFHYLYFSISQSLSSESSGNFSLVQRNRNFITYCVTYKKNVNVPFETKRASSLVSNFQYQNKLFRNKFNTYHNFFTRNYLPIGRRNISSRRGTLRHGWLLHSFFDPPRYFPPIILAHNSLPTIFPNPYPAIKNTVSPSFTP